MTTTNTVARPPLVESLEPRTAFDATPMVAAVDPPDPRRLDPAAQREVRYLEADGTTVRARLVDGPGTLAFNPAGGSVVNLAASGTDARTRLQVSARGGTDGRATLTDLTAAGSLASIEGGRLDIVGNVSVGGTLGRLTVGQLGAAPGAGAAAADRTFTIGGSGAALRFTAAAVRDVSLTTAAPIRQLRVGTWTDGGGAADRVRAPRIDDLRAVSFAAGLTLDGDPAAPGRPALGRAVVGDLGGGGAGAIVAWVIRGDAGAIVADRVDGWSGSVAGRLGAFELRGRDPTRGPPFPTRFDLAAEAIGRFHARPAVRDVRVLAGADLGADGRLGGAGADADAFGPGSIGRLDLRSSASRSVFAAGLNPVNGVVFDGDDVLVGGPAGAIDAASFRFDPGSDVRVVAGDLPEAVRIGGRRVPVDPADARFTLTPVPT